MSFMLNLDTNFLLMGVVGIVMLVEAVNYYYTIQEDVGILNNPSKFIGDIVILVKIINYY